MKWDMKAYKVSEALEFERGRNPLKTMGIGLENRRDFKDAMDFVDWLLRILPDLLGEDTMPEDILKATYWSKRSGFSGMGYIPSGLFNFLKDWLIDAGGIRSFYIGGEKISDFTSESSMTMYAKDKDGYYRAWPYWIGNKLRERGYESV
jgi:hypothetical protein